MHDILDRNALLVAVIIADKFGIFVPNIIVAQRMLPLTESKSSFKLCSYVYMNWYCRKFLNDRHVVSALWYCSSRVSAIKLSFIDILMHNDDYYLLR